GWGHGFDRTGSDSRKCITGVNNYFSDCHWVRFGVLSWRLSLIMEWFGWFILTFFLLIVVTVPVVGSYQVIRDLLKYFLSDWYNRNLFFTKVDPERRDFLAKNFSYYKTLSDRDRLTFERRVQKFIGMKNFESRDDMEVTMEM